MVILVNKLKNAYPNYMYLPARDLVYRGELNQTQKGPRYEMRQTSVGSSARGVHVCLARVGPKSVFNSGQAAQLGPPLGDLLK